jgi:hypothetical protein
MMNKDMTMKNAAVKIDDDTTIVISLNEDGELEIYWEVEVEGEVLAGAEGIPEMSIAEYRIFHEAMTEFLAE